MKQFGNFNVRIVCAGQGYGRDDCLMHKGADPLVEFYDARYTEGFGPRGQFVSRYYMSTMLTTEPGTALILDGGIPSWVVSAGDMDEVREHLYDTLDALSAW